MSRSQVRRLGGAALCITVLLVLSWARGLAQGGTLRYGDTVTGTIQPGSSEEWTFIGTAGDVVLLKLSHTSGDLSPELALMDGAQLLAGTQAPADQPDLMLQTLLPHDGSFVIRISGTEQTANDYTLTLTRVSQAPVTPTLVATPATGDTVGTIGYGQTVRGELGNGTFRQAWRLVGNAGLVVDITMTAVSGNLDASLALLDPDGNVLIANESIDGGRNAGILAYQLPFNGEFRVIARVGQTDTSGTYTLTVNVRGSAPDAQASVLGFETPIRGRLNKNVPRAIYRLAASGVLVFKVDLNGLHRLAQLRILNSAGLELQRFSGLNPLLVTTFIENTGPYYVEVSAEDFERAEFVDFAISAARLPTKLGISSVLQVGKARRMALTTPDSWVFAAQSGDFMRVTLHAETPAPTTKVVITSPQQVVLFDDVLGTGLDQTLTLPVSGFYTLQVTPAEGQTSTVYQAMVERVGANNGSFDRYAPLERGSILVGKSVSGTLAAGGADSYWLDGTAGQLITLTAQSNDQPTALGIGLQRPDGSLVAAGTAERIDSAVVQRIQLDQTVRYRVVVFDTNSSGLNYTLQVRSESGGELVSGRMVKGIMPPGNGTAVWSLEVVANALVNVRLTNLTPVSWTPRLLIADPNGHVIASAVLQNNEAEIVGLTAPISGIYEILVVGSTSDQFAAYRLLADAQLPFEQLADTTVQVSATYSSETRYSTVATGTPIRVSVPSVISRPISLDAINAEGIVQIGFDKTQRGEIKAGQLWQAYRFSSSPNLTFTITAGVLDGGQGPDLLLFDNNGLLVAEQYGAPPPDSDPMTTLRYLTQRGGTYTVVVSLGLRQGRFLLTLTGDAVAVDKLKVSSGTPILYGQTVAGEFTPEADEARFYFIGNTRDVITVQVSQVTGTVTPAVELFTPGALRLAIDSNAEREATVSLNRVELTDNGLYSIVVRGLGTSETAGGRYFLTLSLAENLRLRNRGGGIIAPNETRTGYLSQNNPDDIWLFNGTQGERVSFALTGQLDGGPLPLAMRLLDTGGQTLTTASTTVIQDSVRINGFTLPLTGVYRVQVSGGRAAGIYTLRREVKADANSIRSMQYGQTVQGYFSAERRSDTWAFAGTAGDNVTLSLRYVRGTRFLAGFQVFAENGLSLATAVADPAADGTARVTIVLPFSGTYAVSLANAQPDFTGAGVYALSVILQDTKARSLGAVLRSGDLGQGDLYADDPSDTWLINAHGGDQLNLTVRALDNFLSPQVELRDLGGNLLISAANERIVQIGDANTAFAIPADGVYAVTVTGSNGSAGAYEIGLITEPAVAVENLLQYGDIRNGVLDDNRPQDVFTFSGKRNDTIQVEMTRESGAALASVIELLDENGRLLAHTESVDGDTVRLSDFRLPANGQYRLIATRYNKAEGHTAGRYSITLQGSPAVYPQPVTTRYGNVYIGRLNDQDAEDRLVFEGKAGDVIGVTTRARSGNLDLVVRLEASSGEILASSDDAIGMDAELGGVLLPTDGLYTLIVARQGNSAGNYEATINRLYQSAATTAPLPRLVYGQRAVGALDEATTSTTYTFNGSLNDVITVRALYQGDDPPLTLQLLDPANNTLATGRSEAGQTLIAGFRLPTDGAYRVVITRPLNVRSRYSPYALTVDLNSIEALSTFDGGVITINASITGTFVGGQTAHYWLFQARAGEIISAQLQRLNGDINPSLLLVTPSGQGLLSIGLDATTNAATLSTQPLPIDGVYSLVVLPGGDLRSGQYRMTVQSNAEPPPASALLTSGQTVGGTLTPTERSQRWQFTGQANQPITAIMLATSGGLLPSLQLLDANQTVLADGLLQHGSQGAFSAIIGYRLPDNGLYTLVASARRMTSGNFQLSLDSDVATTDIVSAQPLIYDQAVRSVVQQAAPAIWTFEGAASDVVSLGFIPSAPVQGEPAPSVAIEIKTLSGRVLARTEGTGEVAIPAAILPEAGRYVVSILPSATVRYSLVVQRRQNLLPTDTTQPIRPLVLNTPRVETIAPNDSFDYWRFDAATGDNIQLVIERISTRLRADLTIFGPSGYLTSATMAADANSLTIGPLRLPDTGTYTVVVTRWLGAAGSSNGNYRLTLTSPASVEQGGTLTGYGVPVAGQVDATNRSERWFFEGSRDDVVAVQVVPTGSANPELLVYPASLADAPDEVLTESNALRGTLTNDGGIVTLRDVTLPEDGRYFVRARGLGLDTIVYRLLVTLERSRTFVNVSLSDATGIGYGTTRTGTLSAEQPAQVWVFTGKSGDSVTINVQATPTTGTTPDLYVQLIAPDSQIMALDDNGGGDPNPQLANLRLDADGFYAIVVTGSPTAAQERRFGAYEVTLTRNLPGTTYLGMIGVGKTVTSTLTPARPAHQWIFNAEAGQTVAFTLSSALPEFDGSVELVTVDGCVVAAATATEQRDASFEAVIPRSTQYAVLVRNGHPDLRADYRLTMSTALAPTGGGRLLVNGERVSGLLTDDDFTDQWHVDVQMNATISAMLTRTSGDVALEVTLLAPDGSVVFTGNADGIPPTLQLTTPGTYTVLVTRTGGAAGDSVGGYTLEMRSDQPESAPAAASVAACLQ
ncbi:MAG: hypothetical protein KF716_03780 [Anaerolineae bacterium]|nr:hypothetical protein [Anaerolineae bacterium]